MKQLLILTGVAALASTAPALAQGHGNHGNPHAGYGVGGCPPGLAKKGNGCLPPGQAKKLYGVGHRFDRGFNGWTPYNQIPYDLRNRYDLNPYGRYIYDQNYIYQVDPTTYVVSRVLNAILR
jgi:hypothetical protein